MYGLIDPTPHYEAQTFKGKVVFITGASRGIGAETALYYARAGATVAIAGRDINNLEVVKSGILSEAPSANILVLPVDVTRSREVEQAISTITSQFGRLDILIANAGKAGDWTRRKQHMDPSLCPDFSRVSYSSP